MTKMTIHTPKKTNGSKLKMNEKEGVEKMESHFFARGSGWWFQICVIFTPVWGRFPF